MATINRKRQVIVVFTNAALKNGVSVDRRRIEILQDDRATMAADKIVAASARHSFI
jgi:hypothetical protein